MKALALALHPAGLDARLGHTPQTQFLPATRHFATLGERDNPAQRVRKPLPYWPDLQGVRDLGHPIQVAR